MIHNVLIKHELSQVKEQILKPILHIGPGDSYRILPLIFFKALLKEPVLKTSK